MVVKYVMSTPFFSKPKQDLITSTHLTRGSFKRDKFFMRRRHLSILLEITYGKREVHAKMHLLINEGHHDGIKKQQGIKSYDLSIGGEIWPINFSFGANLMY